MSSEQSGSNSPDENEWIRNMVSLIASPDTSTRTEPEKSEPNLSQLTIEPSKTKTSNANTNTSFNETLDDPSKSSIRGKKSGNILTQLMSMSRRKKPENYLETKVQYKNNGGEDEEIVQAQHSSYTSLASSAERIQDGSKEPLKIRSKSRIPVPKQSQDALKEKANTEQEASQSTNEELNTQKHASVQSVQSTDNRQKETDASVKPKTQSFLKKFLHKQTTNKSASLPNKSSVSANTETINDNFEDETYLGKMSINDISATKVEQSQSFNETMNRNEIFSCDVDFNDSPIERVSIPTRYINANNPALDMSLADALDKVLDLATKLKEDEEHVTQTLVKYVHDSSLQKELLDAVFHYSKVQLEAERRVQSLSNDMWLQQADISRNQERILQDTLNGIVKQNRLLQENNENLLRRNEQLEAKLSSVSYLTARPGFGAGNPLVEKLTRSNDKLQYKIILSLKRIDQLEEELQKLQKCNSSFEERNRNLQSQVQSYKGSLQRANADRELEVASLNQQLQSNQAIIKSSVEAADVLLEDLDALKRQTKALPCSLNWTKFKCRGNSLMDLIHMGRSCINELARELTSLQSQLSLKNKDNDVLQDKNKTLQGNLESCTSEMNKMAVLVENYQQKETEKQELQQTNEQLSQNIEQHLAKIEELEICCLEKDESLCSALGNAENLAKMLAEKDEFIKGIKDLLEKCKSENLALKQQIEGIGDVMTSCGSGDMAKILTETHQKLSYFEEQYYKLTQDNSSLSQQLSAFDVEKQALAEYQQKCQEHLNLQQNNLDVLVTENIALKEQLNQERATITALENEKIRYNEERNVLRSIYQQLKKEVSRVETLEGTVANVNKEASRLAVIAEYNKQLGEKLKTEIEQREQTISELQNNVEILNNAHMENTKDKIALCVELSEVCSLKTQLNTFLDAEVQKNSTLGQSKKEYENAINSRLKGMEEMQRTERAAMRELLEEYKNVVSQRDNLLMKQKEYIQELSELHGNFSIHINSYNVLSKECDERQRKIQELEKLLQDKELLLSKTTFEMKEKEGSVYHFKSISEQASKEKELMENSIMYLQNMTQRLHKDLDEARKSEAELQAVLSLQLQETNNYEQKVAYLDNTVKNLEAEKGILMNEVENLSSICTKVVNEYEIYVEAASEMESDLKKNLEESKTVLQQNLEEINRLKDALSSKEKEVEDLKHLQATLENNLGTACEAAEHSDVQSRRLEEGDIINNELRKCLKQLQEEHESCISNICLLTEELDMAKKQLMASSDQRDEDYEEYKTKLEDAAMRHYEEKTELEENLNALNVKLQNIAEQLESEKADHTNLLEAHKDLAAKLLKSIRIVIAEKIARQRTSSKLYELSLENANLKSQKDTLKNNMEDLTKQLSDKFGIQTLLSNAQDQNELQKRCNKLEQQLNDAKTKLKDLEDKPSEELETEEKRENFARLLEEKILELQNELAQGHETFLQLKQENEKLRQDITALEFQKCELSLRLYEMQGKLNTESTLNENLRNAQQRFLTVVLRMKEDGAISESLYNILLPMVGNNDET